jgi:hypothetical protein
VNAKMQRRVHTRRSSKEPKFTPSGNNPWSPGTIAAFQILNIMDWETWEPESLFEKVTSSLCASDHFFGLNKEKCLA